MRTDEMGLSYREDEIEELWEAAKNNEDSGPFLDALRRVHEDIDWLTRAARAARRYARYFPSPHSEIVLNAFTHLRDVLSEKP